MVDPAQKTPLNFLDDLSHQEKVPYLSVTIENYPIFNDPSLFSDPAHLNAHGASIFSEIVAHWIEVSLYTNPAQ